jgi:hypothetical protein
MLLWLDLQRVADVASTISHPTDMNITVAKGYAQTIQNSNPVRAFSQFHCFLNSFFPYSSGL